jgi:hypothetical protein
MNAPVDIKTIELARLTSLVQQEAEALVELSDEEDTVSTIINGSIHLIYKGRGSEYIQLFLSNKYSLDSRIYYLKDNLKRLTQIKKYILECAA